MTPRLRNITIVTVIVIMFCCSSAAIGLIGKSTVSYDINYVLNGGTNSSDNPSHYKSGNSVEFKDATREGYVFVGWYSDEELTEEMNSIGRGTTGDITVYAKWEISLVGKLLTFDISGTYSDSSNATNCTLTGMMAVEFLDYEWKKGYQTRVQNSIDMDYGIVDSETGVEIVIKNASKDTSWDDEDDVKPVRGEDCVINTSVSGTITCEKWTYEETKDGVRSVETQYIHDSIIYAIDYLEEEGTETTSFRCDLTGIDDQTKTVITKTFTWSYRDHNSYGPMRQYSITVDFSFFDFINYRTDDITRSQGNDQHDLKFVTTNDKYVKEVAQKILAIANADPYLNNDADRLGMMLAFTQYITYQSDISSAGQDEYWKYPVETLMDKEGDCEDTSILFCALAKTSGYDCCLIIYPGHMAAGVNNAGCSGNYYDFSEGHYYYCETTAEDWAIGHAYGAGCSPVNVNRHIVVP